MSTKQLKKQTKREKKARKEAAREAARRAEQRRSRITMAVIAAIVAVGGAVAVVTVLEERRERAAAEAEQEEMLAEMEAEQEAIENRAVACGAEEPEAAGEEKPTFDEPEQVLEDGLDYRAVIDTSCGEVVLDLHEEAAPEAVNSFVFLAERGFYDGLEIFRIAESLEVLQTGAGNDESAWDVGYTLPDELELAEEEGYPVGSVATANRGPDTAGSQFFLVYGEAFQDAFGEDPAYTRFADVASGLDVVEEIGAQGAAGEILGAEVPAELVYMESVRIEAE